MKILIVGRNGVGKKTLAEWLATFGLNQAQTYSTKAPKSADDDSHVFITEADIDRIPERLAETKIGGNTYFTTREQMELSDFVIVDPKGAFELIDAFPDEAFIIAHVTADPAKAREHALQNAPFPDAVAKLYDTMKAEEDAIFADFEKNMAKEDPELPTFVSWCEVRNDFLPDQSDLHFQAFALRRTIHKFDNIESMLITLLANEMIDGDDEGNISVTSETGEQTMISMDHYIVEAMNDPYVLGDLCNAYLGIPEVWMEDAIQSIYEETGDDLEEDEDFEEYDDFEIISD